MADSNIPVTVLGFSQGSATASRWVADGKINFQRLILWAGLLPPDMNIDDGKAILKNKALVFVYGNRDPFLNDSRMKELQLLAGKLTIKPEIITFNGAHDIDEKTLLDLIDWNGDAK